MSNISVIDTPGSVRFAIRGEKSSKPAPTLFNFAGSYENGLASYYSEVGEALEAVGVLSASIDIPAHGADAREGETAGSLVNWLTRLDAGENFLAKFTAQVSEALSYLIDNDYSDPNNIMLCGTSRGGFLAAHCAAADTRFRCIAYIAPVCDLKVLTEFQDKQDHAGLKAIALENLAPRLLGRSHWLIIGNRDDRVSTDDSIAFTRLLVKESRAQNIEPDVELHVMTNEGHSTPPTAHADAAAWLKAHLIAS